MDRLSGPEWEKGSLGKHTPMRERLFEFAAEACIRM
jgi:hypothetical protein